MLSVNEFAVRAALLSISHAKVIRKQESNHAFLFNYCVLCVLIGSPKTKVEFWIRGDRSSAFEPPWSDPKSPARGLNVLKIPFREVCPS